MYMCVYVCICFYVIFSLRRGKNRPTYNPDWQIALAVVQFDSLVTGGQDHVIGITV